MFHRTPFLPTAATLLLALIVGWPASVVRAADSDGGFATLDAACKDLATEIDKALTAEKLHGSIVIQSFTSATAFPNQQINRLLATEFEAKKYKVKDNAGAPAFIKGTLFINKTSLVIETDLHKAGEGRLQTWKHRVNNLEAATPGTTFDITTKKQTVDTTASSGPAPKTVKEKAVQDAANAIKQDAVKPSFVLTNDGKVARPAVGSQFGVSIVAMKDGVPTTLPIINADGLAMVQLAMEQEFGLQIVNDSGHDVGCSISLDGINMFVFSENPAYKSLGKIWVGPNGGKIDGWYHNDNRSRKFQMGKYEESVAAQQGTTEGVGGITVTFFGDPTGTGAQPRSAARPETGIKAGSEVTSAYETKTGAFGELIAAVTIRYQKVDHPTDLPPPGKQ